MDFVKHDVFGKENEISNCETLSSSTRTNLLTSFKITFILACGSLQKAHLLTNVGFHPLITPCVVDQWTASLHDHRPPPPKTPLKYLCACCTSSCNLGRPTIQPSKALQVEPSSKRHRGRGQNVPNNLVLLLFC